MIPVYSIISKYYDEIFPVGSEQLQLLTALCPGPSRILDVACGNGGYSIELAKQGHAVVGVDLDDTMIAEATHKKDRLQWPAGKLQAPEFRVADMKTLPQTVSGEFDLVFCIGNSVVHLGGLEEIKGFLSDVKALLGPFGTAVFQIINFDRVFIKNVTSLPTIKTERIQFERNYQYDEETKLVQFQTVLTADGERHEQSVPLFPILSEDFYRLLQEAGFIDIQMFGDFSGSDYVTGESYMLVIQAQ